MRNGYKVLLRKPERKGPRLRWEGNILKNRMWGCELDLV
jgi:hypothetical protein